VRHAGVNVGILKRTNRSHWWLVAQVSK
jgi:hypothetical protein